MSVNKKRFSETHTNENKRFCPKMWDGMDEIPAI